MISKAIKTSNVNTNFEVDGQPRECNNKFTVISKHHDLNCSQWVSHIPTDHTDCFSWLWLAVYHYMHIKLSTNIRNFMHELSFSLFGAWAIVNLKCELRSWYRLTFVTENYLIRWLWLNKFINDSIQTFVVA